VALEVALENCRVCVKRVQFYFFSFASHLFADAAKTWLQQIYVVWYLQHAVARQMPDNDPHVN